MIYSSKARWTDEEERLFAQLLIQCQNNFREVTKHLGTRTYGQVRSHFYNQQKKEERSNKPNKPIQQQFNAVQIQNVKTFNVQPQVIKQFTQKTCDLGQVSDASFFSMFAATE
ncbi:SANT/Myb_domain [Hexamita inflata]|uniref:SANT/Myb domain n=1 Tax=Hexamita inflata TaxID=28002 RepID=A0AA86PCQ0_9EUKA|nr:SANT/Myb domain [Hexamita inflata]